MRGPWKLPEVMAIALGTIEGRFNCPYQVRPDPPVPSSRPCRSVKSPAAMLTTCSGRLGTLTVRKCCHPSTLHDGASARQCGAVQVPSAMDRHLVRPKRVVGVWVRTRRNPRRPLFHCFEGEGCDCARRNGAHAVMPCDGNLANEFRPIRTTVRNRATRGCGAAPLSTCSNLVCTPGPALGLWP